MTTTTLHALAADYLERLERAARSLPRGERRELVQEISAHLYEASTPGMSDAEILTVLDRLGDPEDIVEAQRPEAVDRRQGPGGLEWAAILLLLFGGFIFFIGWFAGVVMLWGSRVWTVRDKVIGTLIVPGGLVTAVWALVSVSSAQRCTYLNGQLQHCTGGPSTIHHILSLALFAFLVLGPICTSVYLARRAR